MCDPSFHSFAPHPSAPMLYCVRCGAVRSFGFAPMTGDPSTSSLPGMEPSGSPSSLLAGSAAPASPEAQGDAAIHDLIAQMRDQLVPQDEDELLAASNARMNRRVPVDFDDENLPGAGL